MRDSSIAVLVVGSLIAAPLTSCSILINTDERQCETDADCIDAELGTICVDQVCENETRCQGPTCTLSDTQSNGKCSSDDDCDNSASPRCFNDTCVSREVASTWQCTADDQTIRSNTVRFGFRIVDFLSREPPKQIVVNACRKNDFACIEPAATFTDVDGTGHAQFELTSGFLGFFEIHSDAMTTLLYVTKPIIKNTTSRDVPVLTASSVQLASMVAGTTFDSSRGLALLEALDCSDTPASGVQFTLGTEAGQQFYIVDQLPSLEAQVTVYDEANNAATGGFLNIQPGFVTFNARLGVDGFQLGSFNAQIRADTITFIEMHF